jgi:hypothetical protein
LTFVSQSAQEVCLVYIRTATLETCSTATDTVVVIDVWRSFTTAPFAFAAGARDIVPVGSIEEALALRGRFPGALLMGMGELVSHRRRALIMATHRRRCKGLTSRHNSLYWDSRSTMRQAMTKRFATPASPV